jgi:hypothetical protein
MAGLVLGDVGRNGFLRFEGSGGEDQFGQPEFVYPSTHPGTDGLVDLVGFGAGGFFALESGDEFLDVWISRDEVELG